MSSGRAKLREELKEALAAYTRCYLDYFVDEEYGGYFNLCEDEDENHVVKNGKKSAEPIGRTLYFFSEIAMILEKEERNTETELKLIRDCKAAAENGYRFVTQHMLDREYGWFYSSVNRQGKPLDTGKKPYDGSFIMYGMVSYYELTGDEECLEILKQLFGTLESKAHDPEGEGYFSQFDRFWKPITAGKISYPEQKVMNCHQHILEAYAGLYPYWKEPALADAIRSLLHLVTDKLVMEDGHGYKQVMDRNFYTDDYKVIFGDNPENAYLLPLCAAVLGEPEMEGLIQKAVQGPLEFFLENGRDLVYGGVYDSITDGQIDGKKVWWMQCEHLSYLFEMIRQGHADFNEKEIRFTWDLTKKALIRERGMWIWQADRSGKPMPRKGKEVFMTDGYHIGRMLVKALQAL